MMRLHASIAISSLNVGRFKDRPRQFYPDIAGLCRVGSATRNDRYEGSPRASSITVIRRPFLYRRIPLTNTTSAKSITSKADQRRRRLGNDKAVPLLSEAPPQVRGRDHDDSRANDIDETFEESKPA
jgi:hypothetical protein